MSDKKAEPVEAVAVAPVVEAPKTEVQTPAAAPAATVEAPKPAGKPKRTVMVEVRPDFSARLKPGAVLPNTVEWGKARGTGQADGVIWLHGRVGPHGQEIIPSKAREALRYLKAPSEFFLAMNPEKRGRSRPDVWPLLYAPQNVDLLGKITQAAAARGESIQWTFLTSEQSIDCLQPEHRFRWFAAEIPGRDDIWALFYVPLAEAKYKEVTEE